MTDYVVVGGVEWSPLANQPPSQTARALARRGRVLYVYSETQGSRLRNFVAPVGDATRLSVLRSTFGWMRPRQVSETLWVLPLRGLAGLFPLSSPELSRRLNAYLLLRALRRALRRLEFEGPVLWFIWWFLPELLDLPCRLTIYDRIDDHADYPGNRGLPSRARSVRALERSLLERVDLAVSVSPMEDARYHHFPNGVDLEKARAAFAGFERTDVPGTTLVYIGAVDRRVDFGLIAAIGQLRPDWNIDLFGTVAPGLPPSALPSNVRLYGWRDHAELLRLASQRAVGLIPFHLDDFTRSTSPLKLLDYFIAGTPVVASSLPTLEGLVKDVPWGLKLATTPAEWVSCVESLLVARWEPRLSQGLRRVAESHNVENRVSGILDLAAQPP